MSRGARGLWTDLAEAFRGITVTIVTPFSPETLDLDLSGLGENLRFLRESGVSVIVPAGNTGEFSSLTGDEIAVLAERTVAAAGAHVPVVVGVGGDVRTATELAAHAERVGAAGIMIHEPTHPFLSEEGLAAYYAAICRSVDIGVAIYKRSPRIGDRVLHAVASEHAKVVAIKYAHNDVAAFLELAAAVPERVTCACGSAERWALPFSAAGRVGYTSGIANFAPALTLRFWQALGGDPATARALWREIAPLEEIRAAQNSAFNVTVVKHAMDTAGLVGGPVRPPLSLLDAPMKAAVADIVRGWQDRLGPSPQRGPNGDGPPARRFSSRPGETEVAMA